MRVPTIHLNGTSEGALLDKLQQAYEALLVASEALAKTAPNGRDYYPQGDGAFAEAAAEHRARQEAIDRVKREIENILIEVSDAIDAR